MEKGFITVVDCWNKVYVMMYVCFKSYRLWGLERFCISIMICPDIVTFCCVCAAGTGNNNYNFSLQMTFWKSTVSRF